MNSQTKTFQQSAQSDNVIAELGTGPVPAGPYYQDSYFELEKEALFKKTWLQIAHDCELPEPGTFIVRDIEVAKASVLITRDAAGKVRAFHNVCTHRGTILVNDTRGKRSSFSCPYHMWTFGNDGALRAVPDAERFYVDKATCNLKPIAADVCAGMIFVNLTPNPAQGLREFLGPMADMIETMPVATAKTFDEYVYEIDANWKVTFDNFQENYHLRFVHARTNGNPPIKDTPNPFNYPVRYEFFGPHRMNTSPGGSPQQMDRKPVQAFMLRKWAEKLAADGYVPGPHGQDYFVFFPNLYVFGSPVIHFTHLVMPLASGKSRGVFRFYWPDDAKDGRERLLREFSVAFAREIHAEDCDPLERAQRGLNSGALDYVHFQEHEVLCRHLFQAVDNLVQNYAKNPLIRERQP